MSRITTAWIMLLCISAAATATMWFLSANPQHPDCVSRYYRVHFEWDSGLQRLQIVDAQSGEEETKSNLHRAARQEAAGHVEKELKGRVLEKAKGQFRMSLHGCEEPYLVSFLGFEIPDLSRFFTAAQAWDLKTIQALLGRVGISARDGMGRTALIWAASDPTRGVSREFLARLTNPPDPRTVPFLLERGAEANARDMEGTTALMRASGRTVRAILDAGADPNAVDSKGRTPLMYAVAWIQDTETIKALLDAGANPNARDKDGDTVLQYAQGRGRSDIVALLRRAGARD